MQSITGDPEGSSMIRLKKQRKQGFSGVGGVEGTESSLRPCSHLRDESPRRVRRGPEGHAGTSSSCTLTVTTDRYLQALAPEKRKAQTKLVRMVLKRKTAAWRSVDQIGP